MASKLKAVKPEKAKAKKPMILIYGAPGSKKTWESINFPSAFFCDSEGGATNQAYLDRLNAAGGMYFGLEHGSGSFDEVIEQVKALATEKHEYRTFVLDSLSKIFNTEIAKEAERLGDKDAFGASKKPAVMKTKRLINWLDKLDAIRVVVCHEKILWADDKQAGTTFDALDKLAYELDLVLQIKKVGGTSKAYVKKSRLPGFQDTDSFEWTYEEFAKRYGKEIMEKEAKPIELASPEQLKEINGLLEIIKLPDGEVEKWLAKANAESFAEMDSEKIAKCIDFLNNLKAGVK